MQMSTPDERVEDDLKRGKRFWCVVCGQYRFGKRRVAPGGPRLAEWRATGMEARGHNGTRRPLQHRDALCRELGVDGLPLHFSANFKTPINRGLDGKAQDVDLQSPRAKRQRKRVMAV